MPQQFQPVRGTYDLLPDACRAYRKVVETAREVSELFGFDEISLPIFEFAPVFVHIGEATDIVTKETYTFEDRGGQQITLRPEGTAGVVRLVLSNKLTQQTPLKFFYSGPMFRYERPQKGRQRQFHQVGIELIGPAQPQADIEVIAQAHHYLKSLGLKTMPRLEINTMGDRESRQTYRDSLVAYFQDQRTKLSKDSQDRLVRNPLRILDSKAEEDQLLISEAPRYRDALNSASAEFFAEVLEGLDILGIDYTVNDRLVRGLDYYGHTVFEFVSDDLGAQSGVLGGGRYNNLFSTMGGPEMPAVGWAAGVERLMMLCGDVPRTRQPVAIIPIDHETDGIDPHTIALRLAQELRQEGIHVDHGYSGNLAKRLKRANKMQASHAILIGEDELKTGQVTIRDLGTGEQAHVHLPQIIDYMKKCLMD